MDEKNELALRPPKEFRRPRRGQSMVEFALILPLLLAFVGASVDMARVFQAWMTLEGATRDAAEMAASGTTNSSQALDVAKKVVCQQTSELAGFQRSTLATPDDVNKCLSPTASITAFTCNKLTGGGTTRNPIVTVTVEATLPFKTLFSYPLLTQNQAWNLTSTQSYSIVLNRGNSGPALACP